MNFTTSNLEEEKKSFILKCLNYLCKQQTTFVFFFAIRIKESLNLYSASAAVVLCALMCVQQHRLFQTCTPYQNFFGTKTESMKKKINKFIHQSCIEANEI